MNNQKGSIELAVAVLSILLISVVFISSLKSDNLRNEKHSKCLDTYVNEKMAGSLEEWLKQCLK